MLKWYELSIETNSMAVDAISRFLVMNGASGIAVHDPLSTNIFSKHKIRIC